MITYDLHDVPFSTFGSYMSVSALTGRRAPDDAAGLWVRSHHGGAHPLFRIAPTSDGAEADASPTLVCLAAGGGTIEMCFDGPGTLRLRGSGVGAAFRAARGAVTYAISDTLMAINVRAATRRYQVECLAGSLSRDEWREAGRYFTRLRVAPDDNGQWEVAVDEFSSTWVPRDRPDFEACLNAAAEQFSTFLAAMPLAPDEFAEARELAAYINWSATVSPVGLLKRPAMLMSKNWMCNVWSWDHCFNAVALLPGQMDLAWDQMLVVADHQDEYGALPDSVNDVEIHFNFSKPPIHGWALGEMLRRTSAPPPADVLASLYDSVARQVTWWLTHRREDGEVLPYYLHGNDSGWDNSTMFDQGVPLVAPDLAAFLVISCDELAVLAARVGRQDEAPRWRDQADKLLTALLEQLWNGNHFIALATPARTPVVCESLIPCIPILLGNRLPQQITDALVASCHRFLTEWGLATEHPTSEAYTDDGYWRGPIWAPATYLIVCGLERSGEHALARDITRRFCRLCAVSGFAENFDARTGRPLCDRAYTWTASAFLLLAERLRDLNS